MMIELTAFGLCALGIVLPTVPGLLQLRSPRVERTAIDRHYRRDPRYLGRSFRATVKPFLDSADDGHVPFLNRKDEFARITGDLTIPEGASFREILLSRGTVAIGENATMLDVYARGKLQTGEGSKIRCLASDGDVNVADRTTITRWLDVEGDVTIGRFCDLGASASATGALTITSGSRFRRMYANPISVSPGPSSAPTVSKAQSTRSTIVVKDGETFRGDIVAANDVIVGDGATVAGTISCGGNLSVGPAAQISGNLISRGDIHLGPHAHVRGHVFSDRRIVVSTGASVGTAHSPKTMEGADAVSLAPGTTIFGWVICERGGMTAGVGA